jgi:hypothetical protein
LCCEHATPVPWQLGNRGLGGTPNTSNQSTATSVSKGALSFIRSALSFAGEFSPMTP